MIYSGKIMQKFNLITKFKEGLTRVFPTGVQFQGAWLLEFVGVFVKIFFQVSLKTWVNTYLFLCLNPQKHVKEEAETVNSHYLFKY